MGCSPTRKCRAEGHRGWKGVGRCSRRHLYPPRLTKSEETGEAKSSARNLRRLRQSSQRLGEEATTDRNKPNQVADCKYQSQRLEVKCRGSRSVQTLIHIGKFKFSWHWKVMSTMRERGCSEVLGFAVVSVGLSPALKA